MTYWNPKYNDLPLLHTKPDDDSIDFHSDITYMRALLADIRECLDTRPAGAWPFLAVELDIMEAELARLKAES